MIDLGVLLLAVGALGVAMTLFKDVGQRKLDADRRWYEITFPQDMDEKKVQAFIRAIGQNLRGGSTLKGVPSLVFEVRARPMGISHRLGIPDDAAHYIVTQLQSALPGVEITITPDTAGAQEVSVQLGTGHSDYNNNLVDGLNFHYGATIHMANYQEELPIVSTLDFSNRILATLQDAIHRDDEICIQWVISHSDNQKQPSSEAVQQRGLLATAIFGKPAKPDRDRVSSQRKKQQDQNYTATCRVAASGREKGRAEQLVGQVLRAYTSERGSAYLYSKVGDPKKISHDIATGYTPLHMTCQLSVSELASVIAWPMDGSYIAGLSRRSGRDLPAPESVPRIGRVLGESTMPGLSRQVAMSYESAASHLYISGSTGVGKTVLMTNLIRQDMESGAGIILIERDGNLFRKALDQVPPERMDDVICLDLTNADRPLGLNLLRLGKPEIVAGQLATLLDALYPNRESIYANQLVQQGVPVLANLGRGTVPDLLTLVHPNNPVEKAWVQSAIRQMPDKQYRNYWENWHRDEKKIEQNSIPLKNRMWELLSSEAVRNLLNQETSSFDPYDVIMGNKLLFVNLAGVSEQAASLIGNMIVSAIWTAAKQSKPSRPNFLYMDEFQQFSHLSNEFSDMLATSRKRNLGLVLATQYIERLKPELQDAVMANARTKVIFQSSANSSRIHAIDFASQHVKKEAFMNLPVYQALARVNTEAGVSAPITLQTYPEPEGYGNGQEILELSAERYGRQIGQINKDDSTRRVVETPTTPKRKQIGRSDYEHHQTPEEARPLSDHED